MERPSMPQPVNYPPRHRPAMTQSAFFDSTPFELRRVSDLAGTALTPKGKENSFKILHPSTPTLLERRESSHLSRVNSAQAATFFSDKPLSFAASSPTTPKLQFRNSSKINIEAQIARKSLWRQKRQLRNSNLPPAQNNKLVQSEPIPQVSKAVSSFSDERAQYRSGISIDDFELVRMLGKGAFGQAHLAYHTRTGLLCVIKKLSKKRLSEHGGQERLISEIKIGCFVDHPHLTSLYGYFADKQHIYLIMELLPDGNLAEAHPKIPSPQLAGSVVLQTAKALSYLHMHSVIHRDLKPENLFVYGDYVKLGDFGCATICEESSLRRTVVGCVEYCSPEQMSNEGHSFEVDAWSLGVLTWQLLLGKQSYITHLQQLSLQSHNQGGFEIKLPQRQGLEEEARGFIARLMERKASQRMTIKEALRHPFLINHSS